MTTRAPKTIRGLLEGALDPTTREWKIWRSWVSGNPYWASNTKLVMDSLTAAKIKIESSGVQSLFGNGSYGYRALFLDGGFRAETSDFESVETLLMIGEIRKEDFEEYRQEEARRRQYEGAWLFGPRAALFVALRLGLPVPRSFREIHGLQGVTLEELEDQLRLDRAYRATTYVATADDLRIELCIGQPHPKELDQILKAHGKYDWAYITAWNPRSQLASARQNEEAQERLRQALSREGAEIFEGLSEPDDGSAGERSFLALIGRERAEAIGREFGQNAIVVGEVGEDAELVWCLP